MFAPTFPSHHSFIPSSLTLLPIVHVPALSIFCLKTIKRCICALIFITSHSVIFISWIMWLCFSNVPNHFTAVPPWWKYSYATGKRSYVSLFPDRPKDITLSCTEIPCGTVSAKGLQNELAQSAKWITQWQPSCSRRPFVPVMFYKVCDTALCKQL